MKPAYTQLRAQQVLLPDRPLRASHQLPVIHRRLCVAGGWQMKSGFSPHPKSAQL